MVVGGKAVPDPDEQDAGGPDGQPRGSGDTRPPEIDGDTRGSGDTRAPEIDGDEIDGDTRGSGDTRAPSTGG
jgi:hypothetical protein